MASLPEATATTAAENAATLPAPKPGLSTAAIIAIVVGVVYLVVFLVGAASIILKRKRARGKYQLTSQYITSEEGYDRLVHKHPAPPRQGHRIAFETPVPSARGPSTATLPSALTEPSGGRQLYAEDAGFDDHQLEELPRDGQRFESEFAYGGASGIDPSAVEYKPNPVMFPHLFTNQTEFIPDHKHSGLRPISKVSMDDTSDLEAIGNASEPMSSFNDLDSMSFDLPSLGMSSTVDSSQNTSSGISDAPFMQEQNTALSPAEWSIMDLTQSQPMLDTSYDLDQEDECNLIPMVDFNEESSPSSTGLISTQDTPSPSSTGRAATQASTPRGSKNTSSLEFSCPDCDRKFRTAGQRRNHQNRQHNLRYSCTQCAAPFGLRADLDRHMRTVHRNSCEKDESPVFQCTNAGCKNPDIEFKRKDNFVRHLARCEKAIAKAEKRRVTSAKNEEGT